MQEPRHIYAYWMNLSDRARMAVSNTAAWRLDHCGLTTYGQMTLLGRTPQEPRNAAGRVWLAAWDKGEAFGPFRALVKAGGRGISICNGLMKCL